MSAAGEVNLALHKSYSILPKPNYYLCTDEEDRLQLTDGKTYGSNWTRKSTVGWRTKGANPEITIDLGSVLPVGEVRVHSIGGGHAGVEFPEFIAVLVSNDGRAFKFVRFIDNTNLVRVGKKKFARTLAIKNLQTKGRFVKVVMQSGGSYLFLDEIEVISSKEYSQEQKASMKELLPVHSTDQLFGEIEEFLQLKATSAATVKFADKHKNVLGSELSQKVYQDLRTISEKLSGLGDEAFSAEQLALIGRELGSVRAGIYRQIYKKPYVCLPGNAMEVLYEKQMVFSDKASKEGIALRLWQGEYESAAVNVINCSDTEMRLVASVSPLTGSDGKVIDSREMFTIRRAVFVKARKAGSIGDALVLQDEKPFSLMPGQTVQIWLTFHSRQLSAGEYKAWFAVIPIGSDSSKLPSEQLPVKINVEPIKFDKETALNAGTWAYPNIAPITKKVLREAARDLESHYTTVFVVHHRNLPFPKRISASGDIGRMDFAKLDELVRVNDYARTYLFWLGYTQQNKDYGRFGDWMSSSWKKAFLSWFFQLVSHLKKQGIGYDRFALYPFDENLCDEFYELAKLVKSVDPKIMVYANSFGRGHSDFERFRDLVDIWCLPQSLCVRHPSWLTAVKSFGKEVWMYEAKGPGKANDPYGYYRLMPWRAFKLGLRGVGFWVYADKVKADSWDDTGKAFGYYGVVYGSQESPTDTLGEKIIPSRRWEAWREGIEDYQYLYALQEAINTAKISVPAKARQAQQLLDRYVSNVLSRTGDCKTVYEARKQVTETLLELNRASK